MNVEDKNNIPKIIQELNYLDQHSIQVGVFGEDDSTMLMIARVHEFGVQIEVTPKMRGFLHYRGIHLKKSTDYINIPERSYMRTTFDEEQNNLNDLAVQEIQKVINMEKTGRQAMDMLGLYLVGAIQDKMVNIRDPPNHPATIRQKGSSNPLIDNGHLRQSITYKIGGN